MSQLVCLVNPNQVQPGITPYALDVLTTHLERAGFEVEVLDLTFPEQTWQIDLATYFSRRAPMLVGVTLRNTDTVIPQEQRTFLEDHRAIIDAIKAQCRAPIVVGGVGYSSMPFAMLSYLQVPYGVAGPGEVTLVELARAIADGRAPTTIAGLHIFDGVSVSKVPASTAPTPAEAWMALNEGVAFKRRSHTPSRVDNRKYYERGGLGNILTKNGCPLDCVHCSEPFAKGPILSRRTVTAVVDEMEQLTDQGVLDLHTTDSEFNVGIGHAKQVLKEIIARRRSGASSLSKLKLWTYLQPRPFDEELAVLMREAGCQGASVGSDHTNPAILAGFKLTQAGKTFYTLDDIRETNRLLLENGMLVTQELILGMPGETLDTMRQCLDDMLALNSTVLGITFGVKVFPHTPFGRGLAKQSDGKPVRGLQSNTAIRPITLLPMEKCRDQEHYERQFMFDEDGRLRPVFYFSPDLPEDPETIASPSGRWRKSTEFIWNHIPKSEHYRVSLPTLPGDSKDDNNYADNPFLRCWVSLGYRGAFYSKWRERDQIIQEAIDKGIARLGPDQKLVFEGASRA